MRNIIISFGLSMFLTCIISSDAYAVVSKAHRSNASKQMTVEKLHKSLTESIAKLRKGYRSLSRTPKFNQRMLTIGIILLLFSVIGFLIVASIATTTSGFVLPYYLLTITVSCFALGVLLVAYSF